MAPRKKCEGQELQFVVTTNPCESNTAAYRKRVRSQAALQSWPERRKRTVKQLEESDSRSRGTSGAGIPRSQPRKPAGGEFTQVQQAQRSATENATENAHPRPTVSGSSSSSEVPTLESNSSTKSSCTRASTPELPCQCYECDTKPQLWRADASRERSRKRMADGSLKSLGDLAMLMPPSSPSPMRPFSGMADPFNCYPVPCRPWFDSILHHMLTVFAPRGWPALKITIKQGLEWERFMTQHALAEPALFYVRLLFATGDLVRLKVMQPEPSWWIQGQAIKAINEALRDPKRAASDPLILAVGRIALHESMYGDRALANAVHRPAQKRMVEMRGGMKSLEFPALVKRLMRWADTVMSKQGGTERFLEDDETSQNFSMGESVTVLERWVPSEGQELRRKISISDLVND